jgi:hypothetical protein
MFPGYNDGQLGAPNEGQDGQGQAQAAQAAGEGKEGEGAAAVVSPKEDDLFDLAVDKQDRKVTFKEMRDAAQKFYAGDDRLKKNADAVQFFEDMQAVRDHQDLDAFRRVSKTLGAEAGQVEVMIQQYREGQATDFAGKQEQGQAGDDAGKTGGKDAGGKPETLTLEEVLAEVEKRMGGKPIGFGQLEPKLKDAVSGLLELQMGGVVDRALDGDPILGKIVKADDKLRGPIREEISDGIKRRAREGQNVLAGQGVQDALQEVRAKLERLGVGVSGPTPPTGLGTAPGGGDAFHQSVTPVKRPEKGMADAKYSDYLTQRLLEEMAKSPD